jgi:hypothetical protein
VRLRKAYKDGVNRCPPRSVRQSVAGSGLGHPPGIDDDRSAMHPMAWDAIRKRQSPSGTDHLSSSHSWTCSGGFASRSPENFRKGGLEHSGSGKRQSKHNTLDAALGNDPGHSYATRME